MKITLLHAVLMTVAACCILTLMASLGGREMMAGVRIHLEDKVYKAKDDIRYENGKLKFRSDLTDLERGIYLSVYSSDGTLLYGKIPYSFDNSEKFMDRELRKSGSKGREFYLLDSIIQIPGYGVAAVRGVASITDAKEEYEKILKNRIDRSSSDGGFNRIA